VALWEDAAAKSPRKARVLNNLGYAYYLAGRHEDAAAACSAALRLKPEDNLFRNNLALIQNALTKREVAALRDKSLREGREDNEENMRLVQERSPFIPRPGRG
ncbi:MAG TPA: tetratricopeptide repeat protein, partial [Thermodesulfobacteriota bacterium]|nr:tetratricopeptide repeat protein [Thermodesulfobacteriota bacterium]